jgi:hypothetical protein
MDARELQKLWHELIETALKNKDVEQFMRNVTFVISYLVSEQDKRKELAAKMDEHTRTLNEAQEQRKLMGAKLDQLYDRSEKNGKLLRALVTSVLCAAVIEVLRIAFTHKP